MTRGDNMEGFLLFDQIHLIWLAGISFILTIFFIVYRKMKHRSTMLKSMFWLLFFSELIKQFYLVFTSQYSYWAPPLHLCGLGIFLCGIHAYKPSDITKTLLFSLTLPGAIIALLFPGWTYEPIGSFLHIHSFLFHAILVLFVICPLFCGEWVLRIRDVKWSILFLLITIPIIYQYNQAFQTNFMFLNKPVQNTPLQWVFDAVGSTYYLLVLSLVMLVIWIVQYSIYALCMSYKKPWNH